MSGSATHTETIPPYRITVTQTFRRILSGQQLQQTDYFNKTARRYAAWIQWAREDLLKLLGDAARPETTAAPLRLEFEIDRLRVGVTIVGDGLELLPEANQPELINAIQTLFVAAAEQPYES